MPSLKRLGDLILDNSPQQAFILAGREAFMIHSPQHDVHSIRQDILDILEARGGGRPPFLQGKGQQLHRIRQVADLIGSQS